MKIEPPELPKLSRESFLWLIATLCAFGFGYQLGTGKPIWTPGPATPTVVVPVAKVTAATYFFPNRGSVPPPVQAAISELNALDIVATTHEEGTTNAAGQVPAQHKHSWPEAQKAGLPCLVIMAGDVPVKVVKSPKTKQQVLEAVK